jgi:shikimate dehydrogenase
MIPGPSPAIVVSLPARTLAEAREQTRAAEAAGAHFAEVRFDRWSPGERDRASGLFPSTLPLIATLRSRAEGGEAPNDPAERATILGALARLPFRWIDLETARDLTNVPLPPPEELGRILSTHRTDSVSPDDWARLIREPTAPGCVRKVVVPAGVGTLLRELLPRLPPPGETRLIAATTGPSGPLLRAWARRLGFAFVYASLPEGSDAGARTPPVEPSQIPVDRLQPFLAAAEEAPIFGLAGHPVAHSRSPALHARWMRRAGQPGLYLPLDFATEEEFVESLVTLAEWGFRGLNVTHPFKGVALAAATEVGGGAANCGVANCLTFREEAIEAENTDLAAILRRLEELRRAGRWDGRSLSVLGTGGAARATLAAARALGAERRVYGRTPTRLATVAGEFEARPIPIAEAAPDRLVVHATDVGRGDAGALELPLSHLIAPGTHVIDWVYDPDLPTVREAVLRAGGTYEDGTRLLIYQAAASFGLWWGEEPDTEELTRTLAEAGCPA